MDRSVRMNKNFRKWSFLLLSLLLTISATIGIVPQQTIAAVLDNAITIQATDKEGVEVLPLTAVSVKPGDSAYDALLEAANKQEIEVVAEESAWGEYITRIGDVASDESHYWSFLTQGEFSDRGATEYEVKNGDNLAFVFVSTEEEKSDISITVSVKDAQGNAIIKETNVLLDARSTAYDALYQAASKESVELDVSVDDEYFTFVENIGNQDMDETDYWNLAINGEDSQTGAITTLLNNDDRIEFVIKSFVAPKPDEPSEPSESEQPEPPTEPSESEEENSSQVDVAAQIQGLLNYIDKEIDSFEYFSEWWVWSLSHIDFNVPASYIDSLENVVRENEGKLNGLELQKIIIALSLQGKDASNFAGYNLIDNMLEQKRRAINDYIYTLLAIDSRAYEVPEGTREGLVDAILAEEKESGGWALFGDTASVDITGMALSALAPYQESSEVKAAINHAVAFMSETQKENGGYYEAFNGGDTSESVSQAIIGLVSVGIDPTSEAFTKSGGNLLQHLVRFEQEDEGYSHRIQDTKSMAMSTQQALLAYVSYSKFIEGSGLVYQNSNSIEEPNEPNEPSEPNTPPSEPNEPSEPNTPPSEPNEPSEPGTPPNEPNEPGTLPNESNQPSKPSEPNKKSDTMEKNDSEEKLPNTGIEENNYAVIGLLTITMGSLVIYLNRKKHTKV